jgi:deazaflavin-dependent oxidoreductase (nitroreductase family)
MTTPLLPLRRPVTSRFHRAMQRFGSTGAMPWINARLARYLDRGLLRLSGGRWTLLGQLAGLPVVALTTIGARSGLPRRSFVVALPDGDTLVVVASNWGERGHSSWYYNLRAYPVAYVTAGGQTRRVVAREAGPEELARLQKLGDAVYLGYAAYRRRAGTRPLPIMILSAAPESASVPGPGA